MERSFIEHCNFPVLILWLNFHDWPTQELSKCSNLKKRIMLTGGKQGWCSGDSAGLHPITAQARFLPSDISGLSLLLVLSLLRGFFPGSPVFLPPQKTTPPNSNTTRIEDRRARKPSNVDVSSSLNIVNLFLIFIITVKNITSLQKDQEPTNSWAGNGERA